MSKYSFEITGYGGEIVVGNVTKKSYEYFLQNNISLDDYISDWDGELAIPDEFKPFPPDAWFECDDIAHEFGSEMSEDSYLTIYDDEGNEVWFSALDTQSDDFVCDAICIKTIDTENLKQGEHVFKGQSLEEGSFFSTDVEIDDDFDPQLIEFQYVIIDEVPYFHSMSYNGIKLDSDGETGTSGKGHIFKLLGID